MKREEIEARIARLPPDRQRLLLRLVDERAANKRSTARRDDPTRSTAGRDEPARSTVRREEHAAGGTVLRDDVLDAASKGPAGARHDPIKARKARSRAFYEAVNAQLDHCLAGPHAEFLNLGYESDGFGDSSVVTLPRRVVNRNSVRLVLETIGDEPIEGRRVLDVGCGRGGTVSTLDRYFRPQLLVGVDLCEPAVAFCARRSSPRSVYMVGDAERLPIAPGQFDVVVNIESSHSYPEVREFYLCVERVLTNGGAFLYADLVPDPSAVLAKVSSTGLVLEHERDVTTNVLRSCEQVSRLRREAFSQDNDADLLDNFLAVPESSIWTSLTTGALSYRIWRFRKR
jgi:SAM-dependent methyltransferase